MRPADIDLVRRLPALAELPQATVDELVNGAFVQSLPRGATLCAQGDPPEFLHAIISGRVALLGRAPDRSETVIEFFEAGDLLILPAVLLGAPYLMSARVVEDARVLFVSAELVRRAMKTAPEFARGMALHLSRHWRRVIRQVKDLKLRTAPERLAAFIVGQASKEIGDKSIQLPEDRKMVAARLGMTPESLSRAFAALRAIGVGGRGRTVTVANLNRLRDYCRYDDVA